MFLMNRRGLSSDITQKYISIIVSSFSFIPPPQTPAFKTCPFMIIPHLRHRHHSPLPSSIHLIETLNCFSLPLPSPPLHVSLHLSHHHPCLHQPLNLIEIFPLIPPLVCLLHPVHLSFFFFFFFSLPPTIIHPSDISLFPPTHLEQLWYPRLLFKTESLGVGIEGADPAGATAPDFFKRDCSVIESLFHVLCLITLLEKEKKLCGCQKYIGNGGFVTGGEGGGGYCFGTMQTTRADYECHE